MGPKVDRGESVSLKTLLRNVFSHQTECKDLTTPSHGIRSFGGGHAIPSINLPLPFALWLMVSVYSKLDRARQWCIFTLEQLTVFPKEHWGKMCVGIWTGVSLFLFHHVNTRGNIFFTKINYKLIRWIQYVEKRNRLSGDYSRIE